MKILLTNGNSTIFSGGSIQMLSLAKYLLNKGHYVKTVFIYSNKRQTKSIEKFSDFKINKAPWNKDGLKTIKEIIKKEHFDIIHTFSESHPIVFEAVGKLEINIKIIIHIGCSKPVSKIDKTYYKDDHVKKIICVAKYIANMLLEKINEIYEKIIVCYASVDTDRFKPMIPNKQLISDLKLQNNKVVGTIANMRRYKGLQFFVLAAVEILKRGYDYKFLIIGIIDGWILRELKDLIKHDEEKYNINLRSSILFLLEKNNIPDYLSIFDVCVSSSTSYEGIAGSIREAMAMKVPVVCTNIGGNNELVINGKTGYLIEPRDWKNLAEKIIYTVENRKNLDNVLDNGYKLVSEKFNEPSRFKIMNKIYKEVLSGSL